MIPDGTNAYNNGANMYNNGTNGPKKGGAKKIILIVVAVILVLAVIGTVINRNEKKGSDKNLSDKGGSSTSVSATKPGQDQKDEEENAEETSSSAAAEKTEAVPELKDEYHVGDIIRDGDVIITYIASGEHVEDNQFSQPKNGNKYIFIQLAFENVGTEDQTISSFSFEGYADGYSADRFYGNDDQVDASMSAGRTCSGRVIFEVPIDAKEIEIEYKSNYFRNEMIKFVYDGDKDSGYVIEKKAEATADACKPGETIESNDYKISYLSCDTNFQTGSQYYGPKDGYKYIQCKFEIENIGKKDITVSALSFDCYADGAACDIHYTDDSLSATLSPGRKASGTVTFEVPIDATVIELEYETNYWTNEKAVFSVEEAEVSN